MTDKLTDGRTDGRTDGIGMSLLRCAYSCAMLTRDKNVLLYKRFFVYIFLTVERWQTVATSTNNHTATAYKMFRRTDYHHADLQVRSFYRSQSSSDISIVSFWISVQSNLAKGRIALLSPRSDSEWIRSI